MSRVKAYWVWWSTFPLLTVRAATTASKARYREYAHISSVYDVGGADLPDIQVRRAAGFDALAKVRPSQGESLGWYDSETGDAWGCLCKDKEVAGRSLGLPADSPVLAEWTHPRAYLERLEREGSDE